MKLKITSDGTNLGTKLIDEESGEPIRAIQKITWSLSATEWVPKVSMDILGIEVDITCPATVELFGYVPENDYTEMVHLKTFEKNVRIVNEKGSKQLVVAADCKIYDADTNEQIGAIQEVSWEATSDGGSRARLKKIQLGNKDW